MPKSRFSVTDCARMCGEVNALLNGSWVQNIYTSDDDPKTFFFKLTGRGEKSELLIESGVRFHPTQYVREKSDLPSNFAMKLRKHVRDRRLTKVAQLGLDRVVVFTFEKSTDMHHVILEMYAGGNVILTDGQGLILSLLRPYTVEEGRVAVGQVYPLEATAEPVAEASSLEAYLNAVLDQLEAEEEEGTPVAAAKTQHAKPSTVKGQAPAPLPTRRTKSSKKKQSKDRLSELAQALAAKGSPVQSLGPHLIAHCLSLAGLDPEARLERGFDAPALAQALREANAVLARLRDATAALPGYVAVLENGLYEGYEPMRFLPERETLREYASFHEAVDEFYSKVEAQRHSKDQATAEKSALSKVEAVKQQQEARVRDLERAVEERDKGARTLSEHVVEVDQCLQVVRSLLDSGMGWEDVEEVVAREKKAGNPVATLIRALKLAERRLVLCLEGGVLVEVDLDLSAQANVSSTFAERKRAALKAELTELRAKQVVDELADKARSELSRKAPQPGIVLARKPMWFERFHWFLTSEGVLVLGGRDMHQNEVLVKRYLREGDAYLHADIHGAPTCVVRNPRPGRPLPAEALRQAGMFCVCRSSAWAAKVITSAWWVHKDQVSKTAQTGEFLPTGSFVIRGKKNYLMPWRLEMGFGYIFKLDATAAEPEADAARANEWRYLKGWDGEEEQQQQQAQDDDGPAEGGASPPTLASLSLVAKSEQESKQAKKAQSKPPKPSPAPEPARQPRPKSGKQKRVLDKYKDQSEEDRRLAMLALGKGEAGAEDKQAGADITQDEEQVIDDEAASDGEDEDKPKAPDGGARVEASDDDDDDVAALTGGEDVLLGFTAMPRPEDTILYALPFCAPTASMSHFKFRVKLTPGPLKKGKAAKQAVALFEKVATRRERDVILAVTDPQNVAVMMGEVKVSAPGMEKIKSAKRKSKKDEKKEQDG